MILFFLSTDMVSVDNLMDEVLVLIFSFLKNVDRLKAACVCKRWEELIKVTGTSLDLRGTQYRDMAVGELINKCFRQSTKVVALDNSQESMLKLINERDHHVREISYDITLPFSDCSYKRLSQFPFKGESWTMLLSNSLTRVSVRCNPSPVIDELGYCRGGYYNKYMRLMPSRDADDDDEGPRCNLKALDLSGVRLSVDSFQSIDISHTLKHLRLHRIVFAPCSDFLACLKYVVRKNKHLRSLDISWPMVIPRVDFTEEELLEFIDLLSTNTTNLRTLIFRGLKGTLRHEAAENFTRKAQQLQLLHLDDCEFVNDVTFGCIAKNMPQLRDLSVSVTDGKAQVTDVSFAALHSHPNIERLDISGQYRVSADAIVDVVSTLPRIKVLILDDSLRMNGKIKSLHYKRDKSDIALKFQ